MCKKTSESVFVRLYGKKKQKKTCTILTVRIFIVP